MLRIFGAVALSAVLVLTVIAAVSLPGSETPEAGSDHDLTVYELTLKQDSVFALINEGYATIKHIFEHSCFDCHTDATDYPWYHKLPLVKGMIDDHIAEGREHLDMSNDFPFSGEGNVLELLEEIKEEIEDEEMPLRSYRLLHWGTLIDGKQRDSVFQWIDSSVSILTDFYDQFRIENATEVTGENQGQ
ncbi:MAG: heme-binding domain-containing protein [Candidatus Zixiibacteriota bacterium]|nr:MAG: heme-binding domain-containing protein [candidate division Zixibacteria bacterium]